MVKKNSSISTPSAKFELAQLWALRLLLYRRTAAAYIECGWSGSEVTASVGVDFSDLEPGDLAEAQCRIEEKILEISMKGVNEKHELGINAGYLARALGLSRGEKSVLLFAATIESCEYLREVVDSFFKVAVGSYSVVARVLSDVLAVPLRQVQHALSHKSVLASSGLVRYLPTEGLRHCSVFDVSESINKHLWIPAKDSKELLSRFLVEANEAQLSLGDYDHVERDVDLLVRYLQAAVRSSMVGVNILLHGPSGTGKTELTRALGQAIRVPVYEVAFEDCDGDALNRGYRLGAYRLCQTILRESPKALVVFDEIEDAFPTPTFSLFQTRGADKDKAWINRTLEDNPVPAIWVSNEIGQLDPAAVRRFDLVVELGVPPVHKRETVLAESMKGTGVRRKWVKSMARDPRLTAADALQVAKVIKATAAGSSRKAEELGEYILESNLRARFGRKGADYPFDLERYDPSLINTDISVESLADNLGRVGKGTICMYGPPGTGKTAFAHFVASLLERPIIHTRASEILDKFVGGTEQNLSRVFSQAASQNAVLLLDEADGFLRNRGLAQRSWEITGVNELLVQMETFQGILFCATNLVKTFDKAAFRRFDLKVKFEPLLPAQRIQMLEAILERQGRRKNLPGLDDLQVLVEPLRGVTAGDFAAVERRLQLLNPDATAQEICDGLAADLEVRGEAGSANTLGFVH